MKPNSRRVIVLLDRSGSMELVRSKAITAYNDLLRAQQTEGGDATILLVQFDSSLHVVYDSPIEHAEFLEYPTFIPQDAQTALYMCQGIMIDEVGRELSALPEWERPEQVLFVTITDSLNTFEEGSSYSRAQVEEMVAHQKEKYSWQFAVLELLPGAVPNDDAEAYDADGLLEEDTEDVSAKVFDVVTGESHDAPDTTPKLVGKHSQRFTYGRVVDVKPGEDHGDRPWFTINADFSVNRE